MTHTNRTERQCPDAKAKLVLSQNGIERVPRRPAAWFFTSLQSAASGRDPARAPRFTFNRKTYLRGYDGVSVKVSGKTREKLCGPT